MSEAWSVDGNNESDMKCNHEAKICLLMKNEQDVAPFFDPACSLIEPHFISQADFSVTLIYKKISPNSWLLYYKFGIF
jgi:hypothetical protein